jgi:SAM-dependent methyltransferase
MPDAGAPSDWVERFAPLIAQGGNVLDVACGEGRHTRWLLARGYRVVAVDRDVSRIELTHWSLEQRSLEQRALEVLESDLEALPWPLGARTFDGVVVTNYLWRPLFPALLAALAPTGVLVYETFARGNEAFGRPHNPEFLLEPGELVERTRGALQIVAYESGLLARGRARVVQRVCAVGKARDIATCALAPASGAER